MFKNGFERADFDFYMERDYASGFPGLALFDQEYMASFLPFYHKAEFDAERRDYVTSEWNCVDLPKVNINPSTAL